MINKTVLTKKNPASATFACIWQDIPKVTSISQNWEGILHVKYKLSNDRIPLIKAVICECHCFSYS